ncbi:MAG TPA: protein kinase [Gemmatimonadales bacterium]
MYCSRCGTQNIDTAKFCRSCGLDLTATTPISTIREQNPEMTEIDMVRDQLKEEYEILDELGRGGMAIVFKARERQLEREVAIKVLPFSLAFDKEFVERFQREARTSAKLEHPSIIPIYRVGKSGRVIYFVMKFLRGKPLSAILAGRGAMPPGEIRVVLSQVGRALGYAHKSGIVHRDIKPDNIMFDEHGQAVVTDFGIAKAASGGKLTGTGMSIGTPHYMSPEQARAQALDGRSDLYSLGVVAYQCLTGAVPFDGEDSFSIGYKHIMEDLPTPPLDSPEKRELFQIVRKMMAKSPDDRFQTADEMVAAVEGGAFAPLQQSISTAATRALPSLSGIPRVTTAPTTPLPRVSADGGHKRSVVGAIVTWLLLVGLILGGGGYFAMKKGWVFAGGGTKAPADSAARARDSTLLASGDSTAADSGAKTDTTHVNVPPGTPGKLVLQGLPKGARVSVNGQPTHSAQPELQAGSYKLTVTAPGYAPFERPFTVVAGAPTTIQVVMEEGDNSQRGDPCGQYGPAYNQNSMCWDTRPVPLTPTFIPVPSDAPIFPRQVILLVHVSKDGETMEARVFSGSNVETFNQQALDLAKLIKWNPAQKNGDAVDAWVQWPFQPTRQ